MDYGTLVQDKPESTVHRSVPMGVMAEMVLGMTLTISQMKDSKRFFHGSEKSDVPCQKPRAKQRDMK